MRIFRVFDDFDDRLLAPFVILDLLLVVVTGYIYTLTTCLYYVDRLHSIH